MQLTDILAIFAITLIALCIGGVAVRIRPRFRRPEIYRPAKRKG